VAEEIKKKKSLKRLVAAGNVQWQALRSIPRLFCFCIGWFASAGVEQI